MPVKHITSKENPQFRALLALGEDRLERREKKQTLLDGEHLLAEALAAGIVPRQLVLSEDSPNRSAWQDKLPEVPALVLPPGLFRKLSPVATPSGLIAVIDIPAVAAGKAAHFAVLLEDIQEPGNLGALLRTAAAAGVDTVYLSKGCTEAWSPKALRGGQGGHFGLGIVEGADLQRVAADFPGPVYAAALRSGRSLYTLDLAGPAAFLFGNEGAGLSRELQAAAEPFTVPMPGKVESLNVAAAAAVCLFERVRQSLGGPGA
ncbi:MAG TPA: RNA methyltransferase [Parasulfuritortus sp.]